MLRATGLLIGLCIVLAGASGCTVRFIDSPTTGSPADAGPTPVPTPEGEAYPVVGVVDGDTIKIMRDGTVETLRLVGIDTPETVHPRLPVECFGREASNHAHGLLDGRRVRIATDPTQSTRDRYGRLLTYVWRDDGLFVNLQLVEDGYAFEFTYDLPYTYQREFRAAELAAREAERGLWAPETCGGDPAAPTLDEPS